MLNLYITRHGQTKWNVEKRMQGWQDSELTQQGKDNATRLGKRLESVSFDMIYSSPSHRTLETARLIRRHNEVPIAMDDNLKEINLGDWEGQTQDFIKEHYPNEFKAFWDSPHLFNSKNGENFTDIQERVRKAINRIDSENDSGNVLVVTHSVVVKCMFAYFKNLPLEQLWSPPYIHDTSLSIVEINNGEYHFKLEGDVSHRENLDHAW